MATLFNPTTFETSTNDFKFVTKVSSEDIDSLHLIYSMLSQTERGTDIYLFHIDERHGIVYLDQIKFKLLKQLDKIESNEFIL